MEAHVEPSRPVVGVLCIDIATPLRMHYGDNWHSYLPASYVKHLESAGALIVPIWIGRERSYYEQIMKKLNGVFLPGGVVFINDADVRDNPQLTNDCVQSSYYIYELALEKNIRGEHFPLWGTCLGFQLMLIHAAKSQDVRGDCQPMSCAIPVELTKDCRKSVLLKQLSDTLLQDMCTAPFACHGHRYCITEPNMQRYGIAQDWYILATRADSDGLRFITLIEHRKYPFFGSQFHPERAAYELLFAGPDKNAPSHNLSCIQLAQFLMNSFVESCRRSANKFDSVEEQQQHVIWNWQPQFTGRLPSSKWVQCYIFERNVDYPQQ